MKSILLYLFLVGVPLLGIVGLLQVGQSLSAPISLAGKWTAQLVPAQPQDLASEDWLLGGGSTTLSITQSGPNFRLTFDDTPGKVFEGSIREMTINARVLDRGGAATTNPSNVRTTAVAFRGRVVRGTVDRQVQPDRLIGVLIFGDGPSRAEVSLTAMRQAGGREVTRGQ
jgi:hypothetical protein